MKYVLYFSMLMLSSCVIPTSSKIDYIPPTNANSEELAVINIYRTSSFFGGANDIDIFIDGQLAAELGNGDSISVNVSSGIHEISPFGWQGDARFPVIYYDQKAQSINHDFSAGETYYIRWKYPSFLQEGTLQSNPEFFETPFNFVDESTYNNEK